LWIPRPPRQRQKQKQQPKIEEGEEEAAAAAAATKEKKEQEKTQQEEEELVWEQDKGHQWWWSVPDVNDFDNIGLSRLVEPPTPTPPAVTVVDVVSSDNNNIEQQEEEGQEEEEEEKKGRRRKIKVVLCPECGMGPLGYTEPDVSPVIWLGCKLVAQVQYDANEYDNDEEDFKAPAGMDLKALKRMMEAGALTTQYRVTFHENRLHMMLADHFGDNEEEEVVDCYGKTNGNSVVVQAFTECCNNNNDGEEGMMAGPAELCQQIQIGDKVIKVNGTSARGLDCPAVLTLIVESSRPITIQFERQGIPQQQEQQQQQQQQQQQLTMGKSPAVVPTRVPHSHWEPNGWKQKQEKEKEKEEEVNEEP